MVPLDREPLGIFSTSFQLQKIKKKRRAKYPFEYIKNLQKSLTMPKILKGRPCSVAGFVCYVKNGTNERDPLR